MAHYQLDLRQYQCPIPLLAVKKALAELATGDRLGLRLNHSTSVEDIRLLCDQFGYHLVATHIATDEQQIEIEK